MNSFAIIRNASSRRILQPQIWGGCRSFGRPSYVYNHHSVNAGTSAVQLLETHSSKQFKPPQQYPQIYQIITRTFSTQQRSSNKRKKNNKNQGPLMNERLIQTIMRKHANKTNNPEDVKVRLVIDQGPTEPSLIDIVSLVQAMEKSVDMDVDLIAIALDKDPPVVKAVDYSKLAYRQEKLSNSSTSNTAANRTKRGQKKTVVDGKALKIFKFRAKIDKHDLERKMNNMIKYLGKGHNCQITVSASRRCLMRNPNAALDTIELVKEGIAVEIPDNTAQGKLKHNEEKTYATLLVTPMGQPKKKS